MEKLFNNYEAKLSGQMEKSLGKLIINMYSMGACSLLGITNHDALSEDLENNPFLNSALQRFTCELYYRFGSFLAPLCSPPKRLKGNESPMLVDISGCVAAVAHRNFYSEAEHSNLCQIAFVLINIDFVLINMPPWLDKYLFSRQKDLTVSRQLPILHPDKVNLNEIDSFGLQNTRLRN